MLKKHHFVISKTIRSSAANVIANYLDLEHVCSVHPRFVAVTVLSETDTVACLEVSTRFWGLSIPSLYYYEYRPPFQVFNVMSSFLGTIVVLSSVQEKETCSEVTTEVELQLKWCFQPFAKWIERQMRILDLQLTHEDQALLERRQQLLGGSIRDYLRPQQCLLFKEVFADAFSSS